MLFKTTVYYKCSLYSNGAKYHESNDSSTGIVSALTANGAKRRAAKFITKSAGMHGREKKEVEITSIDATRVNTPSQVGLFVNYIIP